MINLFINHYQCGDKKRQIELDYCKESNENNPLIDRIINFPNRITYNNFFTETKNYPNDVNILANTDIYFNHTLENVNQIKSNECYAITRSELEGDEVVTFDQKHTYNKEAQARHSQDVWVFRGYVQNVYGNFNLGIPGCDNRIAYEISRAYKVINPCYEIQCIHKHEEKTRSYNLPQGVTVVGMPYKFVEPNGVIDEIKIHFRTPI
jgi:hypothetical protein